MIKSYAMHDVLRSKGLFFLIVISMGVVFSAMLTIASISGGFNFMLSRGAAETNSAAGVDILSDVNSTIAFIAALLNGIVVIIVFILVSLIMFINVTQRKRQIGILKSMGTSSAFVIGVYLFETLIYFVVSCAIGLGIFLLINFYSNSHPLPMIIGDFHTVIDIQIIKNAVIIMFIASFCGTLIPANIASKIQISDVMRDNT